MAETYPQFDLNTAEKLNKVLTFTTRTNESSFYRHLPHRRINSLEKWQKLPVLTKEKMRDYGNTLRHRPENQIRYLPSEFDYQKSEDIFLIPQDAQTEWPTLDRETKIFKPWAMIAILPAFWQLAPMFHRVCRKNGLPTAVMPPYNLPVAKEIIRQAGIQAIVTTPEAATGTCELLQKTDLRKPIMFWHLILKPGELSRFKPGNESLVFLERQELPGFNLGWQCQELASAGKNEFHPSAEYFWEIEKDRVLITTLSAPALPLIRYAINPIKSWREADCQCGEKIIFS